MKHLPEFWREFDGSFLQIRRSLPDYLHRAIGRFLDACGLRRADYESRQAHYIMALEALFSGEEEDCVRPIFAKWNQQSQKHEPVLKRNNRTGRQEPVQIYASDSITKCCAALIAPEGRQVSPIQDWLYRIYRQRSRVTHGSTFEQEEFYALPQNPDEHGEAKDLCEILGIDISGVWEGPDMGFAVLHNAVRLSILSFVGHAASCLQTDKFQRINYELAAATGKDENARETREHLRGQLQDSFLDEKRKFLQRLYDGLRNETDRQEIRSEVVGLVNWRL